MSPDPTPQQIREFAEWSGMTAVDEAMLRHPAGKRITPTTEPLAPAPLREIRAETKFGEMYRRWATDWEPVDRAEGDGRADR